MAHLDQVLGEDGHRRIGEPVEHGQDTAGRRVLDRHHEAFDIAVLETAEGTGERREADRLRAGEQLPRRLVAVGVGLALVSDLHGRNLRGSPG